MRQDSSETKDNNPVLNPNNSGQDGDERSAAGTKRSRRGVPIQRRPRARSIDDHDAEDNDAHPHPFDRKRSAERGGLHDSDAASGIARRNRDHDDADSVEDVKEEAEAPVISTPSSSMETATRPKPLTSLLRDVSPFHSPMGFAALPRRGSGEASSREGSANLGDEAERLRVHNSAPWSTRAALRQAGLSHLLARKESERTASTAESLNDSHRGIATAGENQHRRRRRPSRPGAIHVSGRAYGPPPAWGMHRLLQEHGLATSYNRATTRRNDGEGDEDEDAPVGLDAHLANDETGLEMPSNSDGVSALDVVDISDLDDKDNDDDRCRHYLVVGFVCGATAMIALLLSIILVESAPLRNSVKMVRPPPTAFPSTTPSMIPTMTPTYQNWGEYIDVVSAITSPSDIEQASDTTDKSPQHRALAWMLEDSQYSLQDPLFLQRYAMAVFFYATDGENWPTSNFLEHSISECEWSGVGCEGMHVVSIGRTGINARLSGQLPSELSVLQQLRDLKLYGNSLTGTIPSEYGTQLQNLKLLLLNRNSLNGPFPETFRYHSSLETISLQENENFGGSVPYMELQTMSRLKEFYCQHCDLVGTLPKEWFANTSPLPLEVLQLDHNELSGTLPTGLAQLSNLKKLHLNDNYLSGAIPKEWYTTAEEHDVGDESKIWPKLQTLNLSGNQFTGAPIPSFLPTQLPRWGNQNNREELSVDLSENSFSGTISKQFANLRRLRALHLDRNEFEGTVPDELCQMFEIAYGNLTELSVDAREVDCQCCTCCK